MLAQDDVSVEAGFCVQFSHYVDVVHLGHGKEYPPILVGVGELVVTPRIADSFSSFEARSMADNHHQ